MPILLIHPTKQPHVMSHMKVGLGIIMIIDNMAVSIPLDLLAMVVVEEGEEEEHIEVAMIHVEGVWMIDKGTDHTMVVINDTEDIEVKI